MPLVLLEQTVASVHSLSAAAWFGALVYRTFFVDPKALRFFASASEYESYALDLAHGMRYVVLLALGTCGLSGFILLGWRWQPGAEWLWLMCGKSALWALAFGLFGYVSWVYWPRRVFATEPDWPGLRRQGWYISMAMIGIAAAGIVMGQLGRSLTPGS